MSSGLLEELFERRFLNAVSSDSGSLGDRGISSSSSHKLPKQSSSSSSSVARDEEEDIPTIDKKKSKSKKGSSKKNKKSKKNLKKKRFSRDKIGPYDAIGSSSNEVIQDIQHGQIEGLDINIAQSVCDDSKPSLNEEAKSYFIMRHNVSYPGPWSIMVGGPNALNSFGYRVSAEVLTKDDCILVGTLQPNQRNVEGVWEQTWNSWLKTHVSFMAGKTNTQQMGMFGAVTLPTGVAHMDLYPQANGTSAIRCKMDLMQKELSMSYHKSVWNGFSIGSKVTTSFDRKTNDLEFGASYKWANKKKSLECTVKPRHQFYSLFFTKQVHENGSALTSRIHLSLATMNCNASFGYKYVFGKMNNQKMICGEISSDGYVKQTFTMPLLHNMMIKLYAEMNHFLKPQQLQHGELPHRFGAMIQIHM